MSQLKQQISYFIRHKSLARIYYKQYYINTAIRALRGRTYLEIGVRNGDCLRQIQCALKVGVDPFRSPVFNELRADEQFYQVESDTFFEAGDADRVFADRKVDVALADGLHEFHQTLRDVLNIERYIRPDGVIFIHDCNPPTRRRTEVRDGGEWNGDVWKVAYYLRHYRPDLEFFTIDCDEGVGVVTGFGKRPAGEQADAGNIAMCKQLDYSVLENNRQGVLNLKTIQDARRFLEARATSAKA